MPAAPSKSCACTHPRMSSRGKISRDLIDSKTGAKRRRSLPAATGRSPRMFIAESGKSCSTTLCKQTGLSDTLPVSAGDVVLLTTKDDGVTVNTLDGAYLGTLQRRLGRRLNRLMSGGNRYEAAVVGLEEAGLSVILRETGQAPALRHVVSFPSQTSESHQLSPIAEPDQIVPSPDEESDQVPSDAIDADDIADSVENAVLNMHGRHFRRISGHGRCSNFGHRRRCDRLVARNPALSRRRGVGLADLPGAWYGHPCPAPRARASRLTASLDRNGRTRLSWCGMPIGTTNTVSWPAA